MGRVFNLKSLTTMLSIPSAPMLPSLFSPFSLGSVRYLRPMRKFGRTPAARKALIKGQLTSLIKHDRIKTTLAKAKELTRFADRAVTLAKKNTTQSMAAAPAMIHEDEAFDKLSGELTARYAQRQGGYTRVLRCESNRKGDNAPMAYIEYVDREGELRSARPVESQEPTV